MGLFNRFRKKEEKSREYLIRSFEPRKLEKLNNIMFERHESIQSSYLKTLSEDELRTFLKIMDKSFVIPRGFAGSDFSDTKTSLSSDFPDFRRLVKKMLKEREAEDEFIPLGSLLKNKSGSFPRRKNKEIENKQKKGIIEGIKEFFDRQAKEADFQRNENQVQTTNQGTEELTKEEEEQFKREEERDIKAATEELNKEYEQFEKEDELELEGAVGDVEAEELEEGEEKPSKEEELEETSDG